MEILHPPLYPLPSREGLMFPLPLWERVRERGIFGANTTSAIYFPIIRLKLQFAA
jgi:hypothetical protein